MSKFEFKTYKDSEAVELVATYIDGDDKMVYEGWTHRELFEEDPDGYPGGGR